MRHTVSSRNRMSPNSPREKYIPPPHRHSLRTFNDHDTGYRRAQRAFHRIHSGPVVGRRGPGNPGSDRDGRFPAIALRRGRPESAGERAIFDVAQHVDDNPMPATPFAYTDLPKKRFRLSNVAVAASLLLVVTFGVYVVQTGNREIAQNPPGGSRMFSQFTKA